MPLIITVISRRGQPTKETISNAFDRKGGTIGRSLKNDVVLPDPNRFISRRHAVIHYENGSYYLKDNSLAGTYIRNKNLHLHDNSVKLDDGDTIEIGEYEIGVCIQNNDSAKSIAPPLFSDEEGISLFDFDGEKNQDILCDEESGEENIGGKDALSWRDMNIFDRAPDPIHSQEHGHPSPIHESFVPPDVTPTDKQLSEIPENFNFKSLLPDTRGDLDEFAIPPTGVEEDPQKKGHREASDHFFQQREIADAEKKQPAGRIQRRQPQDNSGQLSQHRKQLYRELFDLFLGGAGVDDKRFYREDEIPDLVQTAGALLRELIEGLVAILRGRAELKSQIRVAGTLLGAADNNPLKFSPDIEETIKILLGKKHRGFVDAVDAVRESHADIMSHQLAMTAGIQAALKSLVKRFDPRKYSERYNEGILFQRKAKCWDAYNDDYLKIVDEALENFMGEEFSKAYEEQIRKFGKTRGEH